MQDLYKETLNIMKKYKVVPNKNYGQNFLINENIINNIIDKSFISKNDLIIEIGPGLGTLTQELLKKAKKVVAIELDKRMVSILSDRFSEEIDNEIKNIDGNKLKIINEDILKIDLAKFLDEESSNNYKSIKVIANLPYYITTPIIMKLIESNLNIDSITVMVQKEVAERLAEIPGGKKTGAITYTIYYYSDAEIILDVPKENFIPIPEVNSAVIQFNILKEHRVKVENIEFLFKLIKQSFLLKRKTLLNSLNGFCGLNKNDIKEILYKLNIIESIRAEQLSLNEFIKILEEIEKIKDGNN